MFDVCRWLVELIDGSPLLIAPWRQTDDLLVSVVSCKLRLEVGFFVEHQKSGDGGSS